jgi:molecular chaperone DnaJ
MPSAREVLGVPENADEAQIVAAYRSLVKRWHPDVVEPAHQKEAQDKIVAINLAYKSALGSISNSPPLPDPIRVAKQLIAKKQFSAALRVLGHSTARTAEWFYLQGVLLMKLHKPGSAHDSFRAAVRQEPANETYRKAALEAAVAAKQSETMRGKMSAWARLIMHPHINKKA